MSARANIRILTSTLRTIIFGALCLFGISASAHAMPWDEDMFKQQSLKTNEVARSPAEGTVPLGFTPFTMTVEEADTKLRNPVKMSFDSVWHGQRLYNANCLTCHGKLGDGKGPVGVQMSVPSLLTDFYRGRSDGRIFAVIALGGTNMPRYGYKLSTDERWNIINYLRFLQGTAVGGMKRPQ